MQNYIFQIYLGLNLIDASYGKLAPNMPAASAALGGAVDKVAQATNVQANASDGVHEGENHSS